VAYEQHFNILGKQPLSYLGTTSSHEFFKIGIIISALLFTGFYYFLASQYKVSRLYTITYFVAILAEFFLAIIPENVHGKVQLVHWIAAWIFVISLATSVIVFAKDNRNNLASKASKVLGLTFLLLLIPEAVLYFFGVAASLSQIVNGVIFGTWVAYVTLRVSSTQLANTTY